MRMILMFDLPVKTVGERRNYRKFRKFLIDEGFIMHQFSVYSKILLNMSAKDLIMKRLESRVPNKGLVTTLVVTEKQYSRMEYLVGETNKSIANTDQRIVILGDDGVED